MLYCSNPQYALFFFFCVTRCSYVAGGRFFTGLAEEAKPVFSGGAGLNSGALILVSMLSTAFVAHFNAPKFYAELKDKSVPRCVCACSARVRACVLRHVESKRQLSSTFSRSKRQPSWGGLAADRTPHGLMGHSSHVCTRVCFVPWSVCCCSTWRCPQACQKVTAPPFLPVRTRHPVT